MEIKQKPDTVFSLDWNTWTQNGSVKLFVKIVIKLVIFSHNEHQTWKLVAQLGINYTSTGEEIMKLFQGINEDANELFRVFYL